MNKETERYHRQIVLPEIGATGQSRISDAAVLCIGAGGLGCPALLYLAAAGVGTIGIVDFDNVDESNLQRQVLFSTDQVGQNKALAAQARLQALNPEIDIHATAEELSAHNARGLFEKYDVIIDGTDNFATKFLINDAAVKTGKPFVYGSILGFDGQVSSFNVDGGPCYRCLFPEAPKGHILNCAEAGVIGAVAGIIGTTQAMEAIKIIVGHEDLQPLNGRLWSLDTRTMDNRLLRLEKDPDCTMCSHAADEIVLDYASPVCGFVPELDVHQAHGKEAALFIDVRERDEWDAGHIEGAQHFALSQLMQGASPDIQTDREIILYCQVGVRSLQAAQILKAKGYQNVSNLAGGYAAWLKCA